MFSDDSLAEWVAAFRLRGFVETGTGLGRRVDQAVASSFEQILSIEIIHGLAMSVALRHAKDLRVHVLHAKSERGLPEALTELADALGDAPSLICLDAREPGAECGVKPFGAEPHLRLRFPLAEEFRIVRERRGLRCDVIIIPERRLYEDDDYAAGPVPLDQRPPPEMRRLDWFDDALRGSHRIERLRTGSGVICAFPLEVGAS